MKERFERKDLHNTYIAMRHGISEANTKGIIVSHPEHGIAGYGLTKEGENLVRVSVEGAKEDGIIDSRTIIISSDFTRARRTAEIVAEMLGIQDIEYTPDLRERFFGKWEKTSNSNYEHVWKNDALDHTHKNQDVESVVEVTKRLQRLITKLEESYSEKRILLVSHGDMLQILQTLFASTHPSKHREINHLETAEIRLL